MASTYVKDDSGATFIPATQRPDGTWRKARRVKDGYVPQEEVPLYESKGKQWAKTRPTIPGLSKIDLDKVQQQQTTENKSTSKNKKKPKDSVINSQMHSDYDIVIQKLNATKLNNTEGKKGTQPTATDPSKKLKNLRKKLREIDNLREKIEMGTLAEPDKDQLEKVARRDQVAKEIEDLELLVED